MLFQIYEHFITVIIALFILITFPCQLILSIPLFIFRYMLTKLAKIFRPDLGEILTARGNMFSSDDYHNAPKSNIVIGLTLNGNIDFDKAQETIRESIVESRDRNGDSKYPELKQYLTIWFGYFFWKTDTRFNLKNHVKLYSSSKDKYFEADIQRIRHELFTAGWERERPLWEMVFIPNCYPDGLKNSGPHATFLIKFHHSLGDGYAWQFLIYNELCKQKPYSAEASSVKRNYLQGLLFAVTFPFRAAYLFAGMAVKSRQKLPFVVNSKEGRLFSACSSRVPAAKLVEIKRRQNVSISSVVHAVVSGTLRDLLIYKESKDILETLPCAIPLPLAGHPKKLCNYVTGGALQLCTNEADPKIRLKLAQDDYKGLKHSPAPILYSYSIKMIGSYPTSLIKLLEKLFQMPTCLTNFSAGFEHIFFNGHKVEGVMFLGGAKESGISVIALSYTDGFRFAVVGNDLVIRQSELEMFSRFIEQNIDALLQM